MKSALNILRDGSGSMLKEMLTELQNVTQGGTQPDEVTRLPAHGV